MKEILVTSSILIVILAVLRPLFRGNNSLLRTMTGGARRIRERIRLIARRPRTVTTAVLVLAMLLAGAAGCTYTGAPEGKSTLAERLQEVPEELVGEVAVCTADLRADAAHPALVSYWLDREWTDPDSSGLGWLLSVYSMSREELEAYHNTGGLEFFAREGEVFYAVGYATDVRWYTLEDEESFHSAFEAIRTYAEQTVLDTEGVEPFALEEPSVAAQPWESDPGGYILNRLDQKRSDVTGSWSVNFWIYPGSGPCGVEMSDAEYGDAIRGMFSALAWENMTPEEYAGREEPVWQNGVYSVTFGFDFTIATNSDVLMMPAPEGYEDGGRLYFRADGAEELCERMAALWPGPEVNRGRVRVPPQETGAGTAKLYLNEMLSLLREEGHITDYEVRSLAWWPWDDDGDGNVSLTEPTAIGLRMTFAVKPADPELSYWRDMESGGSTDRDGWYVFRDWGPTIGLGEDGLFGLY